MDASNYTEIPRLILMGGFAITSVLAFVALHLWSKHVRQTVERYKMATEAQDNFNLYADKVLRDVDTPPNIRSSIEFVADCLEREEMATRFAEAVARRGMRRLGMSQAALQIQAKLTEEAAHLEKTNPQLMEDFRHALMMGVAAICLRSPNISGWVLYNLGTAYAVPTLAADGLVSVQIPERASPLMFAPCN